MVSKALGNLKKVNKFKHFASFMIYAYYESILVPQNNGKQNLNSVLIKWKNILTKTCDDYRR